MVSPFVSGGPVPTKHFVGRRSELRRVGQALAGGGQSIALVGERGSGKSSLLKMLLEHATSGVLKTPDGARLFCSFPDIRLLDGGFTPGRFWEQVLRPVAAIVSESGNNRRLAISWTRCRELDFSSSSVAGLVDELRSNHVRLAVLLDDIDELLHHPMQNPSAFFGGFRSLFHFNKEVLPLVIASRLPISELNARAHALSHTTSESPYFNFLHGIVLGPFRDIDLQDLLSRGGQEFQLAHGDFIRRLSGSHPLLTQVAAMEIWNAIQDDDTSIAARYEEVETLVYHIARTLLEETWRSWSPDCRSVLVQVARAQIELTATERYTLIHMPVQQDHESCLPLSLYQAELRQLQINGFLEADLSFPTGWRVRSCAILRAIEDTLATTSRCHKDDMSRYTSSGQSMQSRPIRVFYSYSHVDESHCHQLEKHLTVLRDQGLIDSWSDYRISAGSDWQLEVDRQVEMADIILLLVSADFNASSYCMNTHVKKSIERHRRGLARVVPIIVRQCDWIQTAYGSLEVLPYHGKPVMSWEDTDEAWTTVARGIRRVVEIMRNANDMKALTKVQPY